MIFLALAGCGSPTWTATGALDPHRVRMDVDHDGRVTAAEYAPVLWSGPPFANVDADGDGDLGVEELATLFATASPTRFDNAGGGPDRRVGGANKRQLALEQRHVWETLVWMGDTLRAAERAGPDPVAVDAAVASGSLDSPEARAVLAAMRPDWSAQGWAWPFAEPK